jgi:hypothetical protein
LSKKSEDKPTEIAPGLSIGLQTPKRLLLIVEYNSAGGMGEHDATEEGLRALIENPDNPTKFNVKLMRSVNEDQVEQCFEM